MTENDNVESAAQTKYANLEVLASSDDNEVVLNMTQGGKEACLDLEPSTAQKLGEALLEAAEEVENDR